MNTREFFIEDLYLQKLADITDIPVEYVSKMRDKGMLNVKGVRDMLLRYDHEALLKTGQFTEEQISDRLSGIYGVSEGVARTASKRSVKRTYFCRVCGKPLKNSEYRRYDGMCRGCCMKSIIT